MPEQPEKLDLTSMDVTEDKKQKLKQLVPEVFREDEIDFDHLKRVLGEWVPPKGRERFGLQWPGKAECMKIIQQPSIATLKPDREESVNFDDTENLFIEGDNLEVLKLLQKSYFGKVKMIYIDPPYNTGNEFIYPDDYGETLNTYLEYTGQKDSEGNWQTTNRDTDGRFHSRWLNMMYPRLFLAKNLLREDGVIFISIDDHEVTNLTKLCDEIFGEENSLIPLIWPLPRGINAGLVAKAHEYILVYTKNKRITEQFKRFDGVEYSVERCNKKIDDRHPATTIKFPQGFKYKGPDQVINGEIGDSEKLFIEDELIFKDGQLAKPAKIRAGWTMKNMIEDWIEGKEVYDTKGQPIVDFFFKENGKLYSKKEMKYISVKSILTEVPDTQIGREEMENHFGNPDIMDYPKPSDLLKRLVKMTTEVDEDEIILDFFAGSCPTFEGVSKANKEEEGNRRCILVQLPEKNEKDTEAYKAGFETVADIGKERIRTVINQFKNNSKESEGQTELDIDKVNYEALDLGFRVLKLDRSNFKAWDSPDVDIDPDELEEQLDVFSDHISPEAEQESILYELILKSGYPLSTSIKGKEIDGKTIYSVQNDALLIYLDEDLTFEILEQMAEMEPKRVVCLDKSFNGEQADALKTNAVQLFKSHDIAFRTV